jgi:hypothetical protein
MRGPEFTSGAEQYGQGFSSQEQVSGEADLKPELNKKIEAFIDETVSRVVGSDELLKHRMFSLLDSHDPARGQSFGTWGGTVLDAAGTEFTLRERLASAAIDQDRDELDRLDHLEDALTSWVNNTRKKIAS